MSEEYTNHHVPYKFQGPKVPPNVRGAVAKHTSGDSVTGYELESVLNDVMQGQAEEQRQNWLEIERWIDEVGTGGSPSGIPLRCCMFQKYPGLTTATSGWTIIQNSSTGSSIFGLSSGVPQVTSRFPVAITFNVLAVPAAGQPRPAFIEVEWSVPEHFDGTPNFPSAFITAYEMVPLFTSGDSYRATFTWSGIARGRFYVKLNTAGITMDVNYGSYIYIRELPNLLAQPVEYLNI